MADFGLTQVMKWSGKDVKVTKVTNPFMKEWYFTSGRNLQDYYEDSKLINQQWETYTRQLRPFTQQEIRDLAIKKSKVKSIDSLLTAYREIDRNKDIPDEDKSSATERLRDAILDRISESRKPI